MFSELSEPCAKSFRFWGSLMKTYFLGCRPAWCIPEWRRPVRFRLDWVQADMVCWMLISSNLFVRWRTWTVR